MKKLLSKGRALALSAFVAVSSVLVAPVAHATSSLDTFVTTATGGITDAQTSGLTVLGGLMGMVIVFWGAKRIMRFFGR